MPTPTPPAAPYHAYGRMPPGGWSFRRDWSFLVPMGLLSLAMLYAGVTYFVSAEAVTGEFVRLGFPAWVRPVLGVAKVLGVLAIWLAPWPALRHMAYAGFVVNFLLAALAHGYAADGEWVGATVMTVLLLVAMWRDPRG